MWIQGIVNWGALPGSEAAIRTDHRIPAAIGKDCVIARDQRPKRVIRVVQHAIKSGGRIHVPKHDHARSSSRLEYSFFQEFIEHPNAACLDDEIRATCAFDGAEDGISLCRINDYSRPFR